MWNGLRQIGLLLVVLIATTAAASSQQYFGVHATGVSDINNVHQAGRMMDVLTLTTTVTSAGAATSATQWVGFACDRTSCFGVHKTATGDIFNVWQASSMVDVLNLHATATPAGGGTGAHAWVGFVSDGTSYYGVHATALVDQYNVVKASSLTEVLSLRGSISLAGAGSGATQWVGFASDGTNFFGIHRTAVNDEYKIWKANSLEGVLNLYGTATVVGSGTHATAWRGFAATVP